MACHTTYLFGIFPPHSVQLRSIWQYVEVHAWRHAVRRQRVTDSTGGTAMTQEQINETIEREMLHRSVMRQIKLTSTLEELMKEHSMPTILKAIVKMCEDRIEQGHSESLHHFWQLRADSLNELLEQEIW